MLLLDIEDEEQEDATTAVERRKALMRPVFTRMLRYSGAEAWETAVSVDAFRQLLSSTEPEDAAGYARWCEAKEADGDAAVNIEDWLIGVFKVSGRLDDAAFAALASRWRSSLRERRRRSLLQQAFAKMDMDLSGDVCPREFSSLAGSQGASEHEMLQMMFALLDEAGGDADGKLTLDEWEEGMLLRCDGLSDDAFEHQAAEWLTFLGRNQRAIMQGVWSRGHTNTFVIAMRATGATHLLFIHHGNAGKDHRKGGWCAEDPGLGSQGTAQCMVSRTTWFERLPVRKVFLASPLQRSLQTVGHLVGAEASPSVVEVPSLDPRGAHSTCTQLFAARGPSPLRGYLQAEGGEAAYGAYAEKVCAEMTAAFRAHDSKERAKDKEEKQRAKERAQEYKEGGQGHGQDFTLGPAALYNKEGTYKEGSRGGRLSPALFGGRLSPPLVVGGVISDRISSTIARVRPRSRAGPSTTDARPRSARSLSKGFTPVFTAGHGARTLASRLPNMVSRPGGFTGGVLPSPRIGPHPLQSPRGGTYIPIVGDAVFLTAVAHAVASAAGAPATTLERLLDFNLGEAEAILVPLFGGPSVQHLKRPC